jgi:hypothetical protein
VYRNAEAKYAAELTSRVAGKAIKKKMEEHHSAIFGKNSCFTPHL